jgi:hypothetical protein
MRGANTFRFVSFRARVAWADRVACCAPNEVFSAAFAADRPRYARTEAGFRFPPRYLARAARRN